MSALRFILSLIAVSLLLLFWPSQGDAQEWSLEGDSLEKEALEALRGGKPIRARERAEEVLESRTSFIATYVLGYVYYWEEGNLPRARFLLEEAEEMLTDRFGEEPSDREAIAWHRRLLEEQSYVLAEMDLRQDQLDLLDRHNEHYSPPLEVERMWPLVKLGRFEEAKEIGERYIFSDNFNLQTRAYNGLMAMGDERRDRRESYRWGKEGFETTRQASCVISANFSRAAIQNLSFEEAEKAIDAAMNAEYEDCSVSPLSDLASLYLLEGEFQKAISTLESLNATPQDKRMRVQFGMHNKVRLVELLFALGQLEEAEVRIEQVVNAPDRAGMTSASKEALELANTILYWAVLEARSTQEDERISARPFTAVFDSLIDDSSRTLDQWERSRITLKLATQQDLIVTIVRPYFLDVWPWYAGTITEILGPGVVKKAIAEAREAEGEMAESLNGYFLAVEGEAAWREGSLDDAVALALEALEALPDAAKLLRWRVRAYLADSLWSLGERALAQQEYREVMTHYPTVMRHLDLALPVKLILQEENAAILLGERLKDSPRLTSGGEVFEVHVSVEADGYLICLKDDIGTQLGCGRERVDEEPPLDGEVKRLAVTIDRFHDQVFSPRVELTQSDIQTLDGRPSRVGAESALDNLLGGR